MKAMILAAGLGTRLRPLTEDRPKALVTIAGQTLLELTLLRLRSFGVTEVIVNTHHYADMIADYLHENGNFGMQIEISPELTLLDTGGGLKNAAHFFLDSTANLNEPFILHNVDVLSTIDLARMVQFHKDHAALATLAVQDRVTSRYLNFNEQGLLCGRYVKRDSQPAVVRAGLPLHRFAFSGIHIISTELFTKMIEDGAFSIIESYLRMAATGERIIAFRADEYQWRDLGRPESILQVTQDLANRNRIDSSA